MNNTYNYNSLRAKEARLGKVFEHWFIRTLMKITVVALLAAAVYLRFALHTSLWWLLLGLAVLLAMFLAWHKYELLRPATGKADDINNILSRDLLIAMSRKPNSRKLAEIVCKTQSGSFLALRYAITPSLLEILAADLPEDPTPIYEKAREIMQKTDAEQIAGGMISVAIIECHPNHEDILKRMKLSIDDLYGGITWYNYLHGLVKSMNKPRHTGGMGRDLMFGYTPLLQNFAINISRSREGMIKEQVHLAAHDEIVDKMVQTFSSGGRQNVALIGPEGSGRSTIVTAFADKILNADSKISSRLKFRQIFKLDAAALIGSAGERGEIERLVRNILAEAYMAKNVIIWLDNAQLFFEEGVGSVDIANVLLPILEGGRLRMILTMDEQRFLEISAKNSSLANALNKIMVAEASQDETMKIMQDHVPELEYQHNVIYTHWALTEAYRLSERYVHDLVMPGRALNLLESAAGHAESNRFVTEKSVQSAIEKTYGVKMQSTQNEEDKSRLLNMEELIHERMIDQEGAVKAVSDALRRAAAGVRNENRPIGTFLFLGPTGVGKTELAKALSEVYFHGEGTMIRIDLNEFVSADDVSRLIADGATDELSLTSQVMKHPFAVVLLDEIEKAHPQVLTTLLQLLDEGILRDIKNREVSFRDTIVIATSNAGADKIRDYIDQGLTMTEVKDELTNELIKTGAFKPEFLNRFDEICAFEPLSKEALIQIIDLILKGVNKTLEPQKISVTVDEGGKKLLVDAGYDPKLGARPMRRIVQKTVENIVAKNVLSGEAESGEKIHITTEMIRNELAS
ncbi:MAG: AAA family ATPase [Candidatus Saccharibacteria bacterium]|nr:AAA family ATPase [Candidatus Saccharibacteria bacterium]